MMVNPLAGVHAPSHNHALDLNHANHANIHGNHGFTHNIHRDSINHAHAQTHPNIYVHSPVYHQAPVYNPAPVYKPAPVYHPTPVVHKPAPVYHPAPIVHQAPAYKPAHPQPAYHEPAYEGPALYHYGYAVTDDYSGANFAQSENRDGVATSGEYRVALPDGRTQIVTYNVGDAYSGYVADVRYEGEAQYPPYEPNTPAPYHA